VEDDYRVIFTIMDEDVFYPQNWPQAGNLPHITRNSPCVPRVNVNQDTLPAGNN